MQSVARAALLGARGNSGVILSQLIRGAAEELVSRPGQLIDATLIGAALANAADRAYASVREPAEGTILTVAREMAHKIVTDVAHSPENPRLGPATEPGEQDAAIADALERAVASGQESVKRSPELLAALREAGVVDAGGYGLTIIFAGVVAALRGEEPPDARSSRAGADHPSPAQLRHVPLLHELRRHRQRSERGQVHRPAGGARRLGAGGRRREHAEGAPAHRRARARHRGVRGRRRGLAPGRRRHAPAGGRARRASCSASMPRATAGRTSLCRTRSISRARCGALAVVSGDGLAEMFDELGVHTIDGGPTLNPSTYELLAGDPRGAGRGGGGAAEQRERDRWPPSAPRELSDKQVLVAPAASQQAGLAAAVALESDRGVRGERAGARARRWRACAPARSRRPRATTPRGGSSAARRSGSSPRRCYAWGDPAQTLGCGAREVSPRRPS